MANESFQMSPLALVLRGLVFFYRAAVSPYLPPSCRFYPSCSEYALDALEEHGGLIGAAYAIGRVFRCQPWGGQGLDPVQKRRGRKRKKSS